MESILKVNDWREQIFNVNKANPKLTGYFTTMWNTEAVHQDNYQLEVGDNVKMDWLKYLDNESEWNVEAMDAKFNGIYLPPFHKALEKVTFLKHIVELPGNFGNVSGTGIVTYSNVLCTLMNTPFEMDGNKKEWEIEARVGDQNKIYLVHTSNTDRAGTRTMSAGLRFPLRRNLAAPDYPDYRRLVDKHCEKLKQYLFVRWPIDYYRNIISNCDRNFYETYKLNVGEHTILYAAELPGINSCERVTNLNELKSAEHIMCDVFYNDDLTRETINYNPLWWSKAYLINANQCLIGVCDKTNDKITDIMQFNTDKFTNTSNYENLWSPKASWKFLDTFLKFVKGEIDRVTSDRKQFVWKFKIIDIGTPYIKCQPKFLDVNSGNETVVEINHFM